MTTMILTRKTMQITGSLSCALVLGLFAWSTPGATMQDEGTGGGLDDRIDDSRITEYAPSPLPEEVILPMPPEHRMADSHTDVGISGLHWQRARAAIERGLVFLRKAQGPNGAWMMGSEAAPTDLPDQASPVATAITAMCLKAFVQAGVDPAQDVNISRALDFVLHAQQPDGSFGGASLNNYVASTAISAIAAVNDQTLQDQLVEGVEWLKRSQWDESEGLSPRQDWYGGAGYGNSGRPDMSNTQFMLDALYDAGVSPDDPAVQRAVQFLSRSQNLKATNNAPWAGNDGGFVYSPANGGESKASEYAGEGVYGRKIPEGQARSLRSYGSMTYAGFKSLLYAGLSPEDPRVEAAFDWIRRHWTFDENPGVGQQGLFYYYHAMARALRAAQQETITDIDGVEHNWREELIDAILERQRPDGSWVNEADRWMEGQPELVTAYSVLALEELLK